MKHLFLKSKWSRAGLAGLLCLLMLLPLCISAGAKEDVKFSTLFELDTNTLTSVTDGGNEDFTISKAGSVSWNKVDLGGYSGNVITVAPGQYVITDVNKKMVNSKAVQCGCLFYGLSYAKIHVIRLSRSLER